MKLFFPRLIISIIVVLLMSSIAQAQEGNDPRLLPIQGPSDSNAFRHRSTVGSIGGNVTVIDNPLTNNNPSAVLFITPNCEAGGGCINHQDNTGVYYTGTNWSIFDQEGVLATFNTDPGFTVQAQGVGGNVFIHTATVANISASVTYIDHPLTNGDPNALLFVTPNWTAGSVYVDFPVGVYYSNSEQKWSVFNQANGSMLAGAAFNVQVLYSGTHTFVTTAPGGNYFFPINHPLLDGNPDAQVILTTNYNPGGAGAFWNDDLYALDYTGGQWYIYNQDLTTAFAAGAPFNVHIVGEQVATEQLVNGGFEVPGATAKNAVKWKSNLSNNSRVCNKYSPAVTLIAYGGECAVMFRGGVGLSGKITQVAIPSGTGDTLDLSAMVRGLRLTAGAKIMVGIVYDDLTKGKLVLPAGQINAGSYNYKNISNSLALSGTPIKFTVTVSSINGAGKMWIDDLSLLYYTAGPRWLELPSAEADFALPGQQ